MNGVSLPSGGKAPTVMESLKWRHWPNPSHPSSPCSATPGSNRAALALKCGAWNRKVSEKPFLRTKLLNIEVLVKLTARLCSGCRDTQASYFHVERPWKLLSALHCLCTLTAHSPLLQAACTQKA